MKLKNIILAYHVILTIIFVYIFIQFLTMKRSNAIYKFYSDYIMNKYCIIVYFLLILLISKYDSFTSILLLILIIAPFKCSIKELFYSDTSLDTSLDTFLDTSPTIFIPPAPTPIPRINEPSQTLIPVLSSTDYNIATDLLGTDTRFKTDDVKNETILKQIKSQVDFDPYKTNLGKEVIYELYNKYFNNDIFTKLKKTNDDSKQYIAQGNFNYLPENNKVDYDLVTYQNLSNNTQVGINPISDGIKNRTKINRG